MAPESASAQSACELPNAVQKHLIRPTWVEVDLDAIDHNVRTVKSWLPGVKLIGVLKGDACGFGTAECGLAMEAAGVDMLAVGSAFEVKALRNRGVRCAVLLFASFPPDLVHEVLALGAIPTIVDRASMEALAHAATARSNPLEVFVKIDTGLGRLGVPYEDAPALIEAVTRARSLKIIGLYSHLGAATPDRATVQLRRMTELLATVEKLGVDAAFTVLASTPHLMQYPNMRLTAVDPGRLLFGIKPANVPCPQGELLPALRALRSRLIQVKPVTAGDPPDYGWGRAEGVRRYGVLPFGWTDVFLPEAYQRSGALVRGVRTSFLASLSAEHSVVDLSGVPDAQSGDTVTLLGKDSHSIIDVEQVARAAGVQVSDMTRRFHRHLPIVYFRGNTPVRLKTPLGELTAPF